MSEQPRAPEARRPEARRPEPRRRERRLDQPREPRRVVPRAHYDPEAFGNFSETIARFIGTGRFLVVQTVVVVVWILWNLTVPDDLRFDPYPFIFLTLALSLQAAYAAPLILLAQNRQSDRDRISLEEDRSRAGDQKADTEYLAREVAAVRIALGEVATRDFIRGELGRLGARGDDQRDQRDHRDHRDQRDQRDQRERPDPGRSGR